MSRRTLNFINKVRKDIERESKGQLKLAHTDNIHQHYVLMYGFSKYDGEILFLVDYPENFDNDHPLKMRVVTPNGILIPGDYICTELGTFHTNSSTYQNHRILFGSGVLRQMWSMLEVITAAAADNELDKLPADVDLHGLGWVTPDDLSAEKIIKLGKASKSWNWESYPKIMADLFAD